MSHDDPKLLGDRKLDHIAICRDENVEARRTTSLLEEVRLIHDALPELSVDDLDLGVELAGKRLRAPLMISGMTGGVNEAGEINRALAEVAERHGLAMGLGSQRPILRDRSALASYLVRDIAPNILLCGNIGAVQAAQCSEQELHDLVGLIGADALCIHLNPAQEMIQEHGDRDFRGCLDGIGRAVATLDVPVIAKETGCGLSPRTLQRLRLVGITTVDVSGSGGTTWVGVEALRGAKARRTVGEALWDWGIPTAAAVGYAARAGMTTIASGGIRDGHDALRALALGARVASAALPFLRAVSNDGVVGADAVAQAMTETIRAGMLLTGCRTPAALTDTPRVMGPNLERWLRSEIA